MARKLLVSRLGAGSITVALCAALPGCNLAIGYTNCFGDPSSRNMSSVECPDAAADGNPDLARDTTSDNAGPPGANTAADRP